MPDDADAPTLAIEWSRREGCEMSTVSVNGTTLYYERTGHGPAALFLHGMCGDADVWADQAERLSDRCTCVRYDRRGHSRSERGDAVISDALHADDAAALIEALELAPCLLVGSSGGAAVALEVALRHGHLLRGAVLSEPPLFCLDRDAGAALIAELMPRMQQAMETGGPRAGIDAFFSFVCPGLWSAVDETRRDRYWANADIGLTDLRSPSLDVTPADLAGVTTPTLVLAGSTSHPAFGSIARRLAAALPDARLVELEGSGHVTYAERPDDFARAVAAFAAEVDRRQVAAVGAGGGAR
jgi:3-oxoadipate enol-lactonase